MDNRRYEITGHCKILGKLDVRDDLETINVNSHHVIRGESFKVKSTRIDLNGKLETTMRSTHGRCRTHGTVQNEVSSDNAIDVVAPVVNIDGGSLTNIYSKNLVGSSVDIDTTLARTPRERVALLLPSDMEYPDGTKIGLYYRDRDGFLNLIRRGPPESCLLSSDTSESGFEWSTDVGEKDMIQLSGSIRNTSVPQPLSDRFVAVNGAPRIPPMRIIDASHVRGKDIQIDSDQSDPDKWRIQSRSFRVRNGFTGSGLVDASGTSMFHVEVLKSGTYHCVLSGNFVNANYGSDVEMPFVDYLGPDVSGERQIRIGTVDGSLNSVGQLNDMDIRDNLTVQPYPDSDIEHGINMSAYLQCEIGDRVTFDVNAVGMETNCLFALKTFSLCRT